MSQGGFTATSVERSRTWTAWQGDLEQFRRLTNVFEEVCDERRQAVVEALINRGVNPELLPSVSTIMAVRERDGEYSGALRTMLNQFDRRTALGVLLYSNIIEEESLVLDLGADQRFTQIALSVRSAEPAVGRALFARLSDEIERGVPWWGRGPRALRYVVILLALALVLALAGGLRLTATRDGLQLDLSGAFGWAILPFLWRCTSRFLRRKGRCNGLFQDLKSRETAFLVPAEESLRY